MVISLNKRVVPIVSSIASRYSGDSVCVTIDSSKTNTAIWVMSRTYKGLDLIEFNGSADKDVFALIKEQRDCIKQIFNGAKIVDGGIEDIITTKDEESGGRFSEGLKHHHSRYVITAVYISIICAFQDNFNVNLEPIPNQAWKSAVLPAHLNKKSVYKGSVEFIRTIYPQYITGVNDDDGTDAICMGMYLKMRRGLSKSIIVEDIPDNVEMEINPCKYKLFGKERAVKEDMSVQFVYNDNLSLDQNARMIANRITKEQLGWTVLPIESIELKDIYDFCSDAEKFEERTTHLKLIVKRTG